MLVQVSLEPGDLARIAGVPDTDWVQRRTIRAGTCAGQGVHWFVSDPPAAAMLSVGDDPETAQLSVVLAKRALKRLLDLAASET